LRLTSDGLLVDEKTGEVINEYGATRFDVAVRAIRGEFDPPRGVENTERNTGVLLDSLIQWPSTYDFQFVVKPSETDAASSLAEELRKVVETVCQADVSRDSITCKERMGGKYLSITVPALVREPGLIQQVFSALEDDERMVMKY
jgi:putative lipoic acid-binding regulatory protein